jgi:hypothetical protein
MAIEDWIARGVTPPQAPDPMETAARMYQLRDLMELGRVRQLQEQRMRQDMADDQAARQLSPDATDQQVLSALGVKNGAAVLKVRREQQKAQSEALTAEIEHNIAKAKRLAQLAGWATDQNSYSATLPVIDRENLIPPELRQQIPLQYNPDVVKQFQTQALTAVEQLQEVRNRIKGQQETEKFEHDKSQWPAEDRKAAADATYAELKAQGKEPIQPKDQATLDETAEFHNWQAADWAERRKLERRRVDLEATREGRLAAQDKNLGMTPNNMWTSVKTLQNQEEDLHTQRSQLGNALGKNNIYVDEKGATWSMGDASKGKSDVADSLRKDMQLRYQRATEQIKKVIAEKNGLLERLNMPPQVSTSQAYAMLDAGDAGPQPAPSPSPSPAQRATPSPQASPSPKPSASPKASHSPSASAKTAAKTATSDQVAAYARRQGISFAAAKQEFIQSGIQVK